MVPASLQATWPTPGDRQRTEVSATWHRVRSLHFRCQSLNVSNLDHDRPARGVIVIVTRDVMELVQHRGVVVIVARDVMELVQHRGVVVIVARDVMELVQHRGVVVIVTRDVVELVQHRGVVVIVTRDVVELMEIRGALNSLWYLGSEFSSS